MPGIFISYRREDSSGYAGRLFDLLSGHFGREHTFMDLDAIQGGDDFTEVIDKRVSQCDVLLAVIGAKWLTSAGADGTRRLDQADDFVRLEIAKAIERGVRVIPVLVGGGAMPQQDALPPDLRPLALRQAVELRDAYFRPDTERLIGLLGTVIPPDRKRWFWVGGAALVVAAVLVGLLLFRRVQPAPHATATPAASRQVIAPAAPPPVNLATGKAVGPRPSESAKVAGTWKATVKYDWPGAIYDETFKFEVDGAEVSGTASFLGLGRGIFDGKVNAKRITFITKTQSEFNGQISEDIHSYKGTIEGDTIRFLMLTDSKVDSHVPVSFSAVRFSSK